MPEWSITCGPAIAVPTETSSKHLDGDVGRLTAGIPFFVFRRPVDVCKISHLGNVEEILEDKVVFSSSSTLMGWPQVS